MFADSLQSAILRKIAPWFQQHQHRCTVEFIFFRIILAGERPANKMSKTKASKVFAAAKRRFPSSRILQGKYRPTIQNYSITWEDPQCRNCGVYHVVLEVHSRNLSATLRRNRSFHGEFSGSAGVQLQCLEVHFHRSGGHHLS